jgi:hypothetical protein
MQYRKFYVTKGSRWREKISLLLIYIYNTKTTHIDTVQLFNMNVEKLKENSSRKGVYSSTGTERIFH